MSDQNNSGYIKGQYRDAKIGDEAIEDRFGFHKATIEGENATLPKHRDLRLRFREFAEFLDELLPSGRTKEVAFQELETAAMWCHKAIAELAPVIVEVPDSNRETIRRIVSDK